MDRNGIVGRLVRAVRLFRPRTLAQLGKTDARLQQQITVLAEEVRTLRTAVAVIARKEQQLRDILEAEYGSDDPFLRFDALVRRLPLAEHVRGAIAAAPIRDEPFPHGVVEHLLPAEYYEALVAALPADLFADRSDDEQQLVVPSELSPRSATEMWRHMADAVVEATIKPAVLARLHDAVTAWLRQVQPALVVPPDQVRLVGSDGRLVGPRPGSRIAPHRDTKRTFITCLVGLAREGEDARWKVQLFTVEGARKDARRRVVGEVAFGPNQALVLFDAGGAHGAQIPPDAKPGNPARCLYRFSIGVDRRMIRPSG